MPTADVNGTRLYYETTGEGFPLVFSHEFAGDYRSWEPQVRFFSRRYRVITYNHRGYPPSDVPAAPEAYSEDILVEDLCHLLRYLEISKAHIAGLSMGAGITLNFGLKHPETCASLIVASCGAGSANREQFMQQGRVMVEQLEKEGMKAFAEFLNQGPGRLRFRQKDPRGWQESKDQMSTNSDLGSDLIFRGVQLKRASIFDHEVGLKQLHVPTLLMMGDEDEPCVEPTLFMKRQIPHADLVVLPQMYSGRPNEFEELSGRKGPRV